MKHKGSRCDFTNFNSIKVRLKQQSSEPSFQPQSYFNSIKVRLKLKTKMDNNIPLSFQFHKGTIKTVYDTDFLALYEHFNSIKVRLKLIWFTPYYI